MLTPCSGSYDDLLSLSSIARRYAIHFHVDAAWGGPLIFSSLHAYLLQGIQFSDSITVDGHKQLYTPLGIGLLLLRDAALTSVIQKTAEYIIRQRSFDSGRFSLEGSRPASVLYLHASLSLIGPEGFDTILTRSVSLTSQFYRRIITHPLGAFEAIHKPMSNILLYRYIPTFLRNQETFDIQVMDKINETLQSAQSTAGQGFVSRTRVRYNGQFLSVLRLVISNPLTQWDDLQDLLNEQIRLGISIEREFQLRQKIDQLSKVQPGWPFDL